MKTIHFQKSIDAPADIIWQILWDQETYPKWTAPFSEGSYAVSDWKEGSSVAFLGPDGGGIQSIIDRMEPNHLMRFRHMGVLKNGKPQDDEESREWTGAMEKYQLSEDNGNTMLDVAMDTTEQMSDYFTNKFPEALEVVKQLSEDRATTQGVNKK